MRKQFLRIITLLVLFLVSFLLTKYFPTEVPKKEVSSQKITPIPQYEDRNVYQAKVTKVVDGDTINVLIDSKAEKVRILGINTPETVDPRKPVECFGREASDKAKSILTGQTVRLNEDPTQDNRDKYGRLLRYVILPDGEDFGLQMIKEGYAYEYTYDIPYKYQKEYKSAQKEAEKSKLGLWEDGACSEK